MSKEKEDDHSSPNRFSYKVDYGKIAEERLTRVGVPAGDSRGVALKVTNLSLAYGEHIAIDEVNLEIHQNTITAIIGPSGCGKSTLLKAFNRMHEVSPTGARMKGNVVIHGDDIYGSNVDPTILRCQVGMVFQKPNPFPKSIYDNVAFGPKVVNGHKGSMDELVERSLKKAMLWDEVKDRLKDSAFTLSGGQQQRLCMARALAMDPEVLLLDEPCSSLDPPSTFKIEEVLEDIAKECTILIVTHNIGQAARISDMVIFLMDGKLIECASSREFFVNPKDPRAEAFISGRMG